MVYLGRMTSESVFNGEQGIWTHNYPTLDMQTPGWGLFVPTLDTRDWEWENSRQFHTYILPSMPPEPYEKTDCPESLRIAQGKGTHREWRQKPERDEVFGEPGEENTTPENSDPKGKRRRQRTPTPEMEEVWEHHLLAAYQESENVPSIQNDPTISSSSSSPSSSVTPPSENKGENPNTYRNNSDEEENSTSAYCSNEKVPKSPKSIPSSVSEKWRNKYGPGRNTNITPTQSAPQVSYLVGPKSQM